VSLAIDVQLLDVPSPDERPTTGTACGGCGVTLREGEEGFCRTCMAVVAMYCVSCEYYWTLPRVPDLWPPCPECKERDFVATTARATIAVSHA